MYNKLSSFLLAAIFLGALANIAQVAASSTVAINVFGASSIWWVAVLPQNDNGLTTKVEVQDAIMSSFAEMPISTGWGYYTFTSTSGQGFSYPVSFRLTSSSGSQIITQISSIVPNAVVDTGAVYGGSSSTQAPTSAPTSAPTTKPPSAATSAPTTAPTAAPTAAPTTVPTINPTSAPTADLCAIVPPSSEPIKLLVPLYVYPGAAWDELIAAASQVQIIAIINPNSGPLSSVDSTYATYMTKLKNAGIVIVGYLHTSYGARAIGDVQADINTYASLYPLVTGIFVDEAATEASEVAYYTQVYNAIMAKPGYAHAILNPGQQPDEGYLAISTNLVMYENYASSLSSASYSSWITCAPTAAQKSGYKYKFSGIVHTAAAADEASYISTIHNMGMGLVYVTDGVGGCCTYNTLTSYFSQEAASINSMN